MHETDAYLWLCETLVIVHFVRWINDYLTVIDAFIRAETGVQVNMKSENSKQWKAHDNYYLILSLKIATSIFLCTSKPTLSLMLHYI